MPGIYVGVLVVAGIRYWRTREPKLLLVMALFALLAAAQMGSLSRRMSGVFHIGAGLAGCAIVFLLAPYAERSPR